MKLFFDMLPIAIFFVTYKVWDIYIATGTLIISVIAQISFLYLKGKKPETMHWITLLFVLPLGGATLYLRDETFIKWKPTAVYWILATIFIMSYYIGKKTVVERLLGSNMKLPLPIWHKLNFCWSAFFFLMGLLNLYVVYNFDTNTWVNFKLFGTLGLTIAFVIIQYLAVARYIPQEPQNGTH